MNNENNNAVLDEVLSGEESGINRFLLNFLSNNGALDNIIDETRAQVLASQTSVESLEPELTRAELDAKLLQESKDYEYHKEKVKMFIYLQLDAEKKLVTDLDLLVTEIFYLLQNCISSFRSNNR